MDLSLSTREAGAAHVVSVAGEIDVYTAPKLRERLVGLVNTGATRLIVDLTQVDFIDSTGLGVLVGVLKRLRARGGTMCVVCSEESLLRVFRITGLDQVFTIHATVDEATTTASTEGSANGASSD